LLQVLWVLLVFELWHRNFLEPRGLLRDASNISVLGNISKAAADGKSQPAAGSEAACPLKS